MASSAKLLLCLAFLIGVFSLSATARPCKSFFISSYSISFKPSFDPNSNPNPNDLLFQSNPSSRSGFITVFTEVSQIQNPRQIFIDHPISIDEAFPHHHHHHPYQGEEGHKPVLSSGLSWYEYDFSSLSDRAKDILSVVVALLFGVGCGALTAATMYLAWSLFSNRHEFCNSYTEVDSDVEYEDLDDEATFKKIGYVSVPVAAVPVDSEPVQPKEVA